MGLLDRVLRAGEGRRVKQLAELVAPINELEPGLHAAAWANDRRARRIKARIGLQAPADVSQPLNPPPKEKQAYGNLDDCQDVKERLHLS